MQEMLVLVNANDKPVGYASHAQAHEAGLLHRAFSILIVDSRGRLLLQRLADGKYHSGGLWSNSCCGHPHRGETLTATTSLRLYEEMGIQCPLHHITAIIYRANLSNGLIEYEYDHIYAGLFDGSPNVDPVEVPEWRWLPIDQLAHAIETHPSDFTASFRIIVNHAKLMELACWRALIDGRRRN